MNFEFLPVSKEDMQERGWWWYDFLLVTGDAYVDHPSFGPAVIARVLEADGYRVAVLAQPDWHSAADFLAFGRPRLGVLIGAGNLDSMVAHYTAAKKRRSEDFYSPGKKAGKRPDRATIVYANRAREAFGSEVPIIIGGLEASLRRFAHYDYWDDKVRRSILFDSGADLLVYGMAEEAEREIARRLKKKIPVSEMHDIRGTAFIAASPSECAFESVSVPSYAEVRENKRLYADATRIEYREHDPVRGKAIIQEHDGRYLIVNPPMMPLETKELDRVAELPYVRTYHPMYEAEGGVPAIEEVRFSVIHNRGCFGGCNFCALAFHQGRMVTSRSHESVIREVTELTKLPDFKGYINDVGGPSANFRHHSCKKQAKFGMCPDKRCLAPTPCPNLDADHSDYLALLRKLRSIPGVKKVFVRSGIRYDYMLEDKNDDFFTELVRYHISGQLKVAPEHCIDGVLDYMGKPHIEVYERFMDKYRRLNDRYSKEQYVVPYLMSSHPGSTLGDAVALAEYLNKKGRQPEQVQDFYPTPGTVSTCMYYTEIDPMTMKQVYVAKSFHEKAMQRALLQWKRPDKRRLVIEALKEAGREDLIGYGPECLVRPDVPKRKTPPAKKPEEPKKPSAPKSKKGWAKAKPKPGRGKKRG
ncbi:MAG: YgiQ family radical SAM protein [Oscillospiraceae bacterium]|nr:YgiQ family radical SAM protein [Oscillospiraceae bacterium]